MPRKQTRGSAMIREGATRSPIKICDHKTPKTRRFACSGSHNLSKWARNLGARAALRKSERQKKDGAMTDKVLVAKFDSEAAARQAAGALEASGVSATAIRQQTGALAHEPSEQSAGDIWDWLLGEESPVRDKSIWRGGGGATALAVTVPETKVESAEALMRASGARQVESYLARAQQDT